MSLRAFVRGRVGYAAHCLGILTPGITPRPLVADRTVPGDVSGWPSEDLGLLIEEGRRHLDRLLGDLDRTRARAQHAFTVALALLVIVAAQLPVGRQQGGRVKTTV